MIKATIGAILYRAIRAYAIQKTEKQQKKAHLGKDLEPAIIWGDRLMHTLPNWLRKLGFHFKIPPSIGVQLHTLYFPSPIIISAFKDDLTLLDTWLMLGAGGATLKTLMSAPRSGNPRPRIQQVTIAHTPALINAMGLPSKGITATLKELKTSSLWQYNRPIGISIGGHCQEEYFENTKIAESWAKTLSLPTGLSKNAPDVRFIEGRGLGGADGAFFDNPPPIYFELNISCPNTAEGQDMMKNPSILDHLLTDIRHLTKDRVIGVKLSPSQSNDQLIEMATIIKKYPNMYICIGNTAYRKCEDVGLSATDISIGGGGLSGPPLFPRTLEMVKLLAPIGIPIMAVGGIDSPSTAKQALDAGATLIGMATALVLSPYCVPQINHEIYSSL